MLRGSARNCERDSDVGNPMATITQTTLEDETTIKSPSHSLIKKASHAFVNTVNNDHGPHASQFPGHMHFVDHGLECVLHQFSHAVTTNTTHSGVGDCSETTQRVLATWFDGRIRTYM